jgi:hypothetical protein
MPVPDAVIFANTDGEILTYGNVRMLDGDERLRALKKRFDHWLIRQTDALIAKDEAGKGLINAPFPLVIMSCVALETLGCVFFDDGVKREDTKEVFEKAAIFTDPELKGPMVKGFMQKMRLLWPNSDLKGVKSASDVIYKFFRNSMFHGYRARGAYITGEIDPKAWGYDEGYILVHPDNFWRMVRDNGYTRMFEAVFSEKNPEMGASAHKYISGLLE